ncbi:MAG: prolyl oligopeptidase family serine peptidase [Anaerolineales bacterium]
MTKIILETFHVDSIPVLSITEETTEPHPLVVYIHGYMANKEQGLVYGYELARLGFHFISFDAVMHGDRFEQELEDMWNGKGTYVYPFETGLDNFFLMHEVIIQAARDLEVLTAHFAETGKVDASRVGVTGFSMGGFATHYIAANNPGIQAAVSIAGIPAFATRWRDVVLETSSYQKWAEAMKAVEAETKKRTDFIDRIDPFSKMTSFHPKPLLMICGDKDLDSPKIYSVDLYRTLKPVYSDHPERLRLSIHDEAGHQLTSSILQEACSWFSTHLMR